LQATHAHTLCVVGASPQAIERVDAVLRNEPPRLNTPWRPALHAEADVLIIDTESVYGHMDWLRATSHGRLAVAYTDAPDTADSEFVLRKPLIAADLIAVLNRIDARLPKRISIVPTPAPVMVEVPPAPVAAVPVGEAANAPAAPAHLADLLDSAAVDAPLLQLAADGLPTLLLDPARGRWHSSASLKALSGWCRHALVPDDIRTLDAGRFAAAAGNLPVQPYARLRWLAHLVRHEGALAPGLDSPGARYKLARWPQSEREFPKHFRIATVMLKQAATAEEIAEQSGAALTEVNDFINAYHAVGYIEGVAAESANEEPRRGGLFGRARRISAN
jgi:hypothetical protein